MLQDFLISNNDNDVVIEAVSSMAIMLGEDPETACESDANIKATTNKFKDRIRGIITKIKTFIQKCIMWLKGKFINLFKMDKINIDQELWLNISNALAQLDKAKAGFKSSFNIGVFAAKHKEQTFDDDSVKMATKIEKVHDEVKSKLDAVINGAYYKNAVDRKTNGKTVTISTTSLSKEKQSIAQDLEALNAAIKELETAAANTNTDFVNYQKGLSLLTASMNLRVEALNKQITLINIVISQGERQNNKEKNNQRLN